MALDADSLALEIRDALVAELATDEDITIYDTEETRIVWHAVATAIVNHIKNNAEVVDNGTILVPAGNWSVQ